VVTAALSCGAFLLPAPSRADAEETPGLSEVVVTARKETEKLQDVPLTITALTGGDLKAATATSLIDISFLTPGLTYNSPGGAQANAAPVIRGLSDTSGGESTSSNVSVFLDGIYIANPSAIDLSLGGFVDRVEIVEGPVSGFYGRNAFTGAINYVTVKPTQDFHVDAAVTGGDKGRGIGEIAAGGGLIGGILAGRVAASYDYLRGTFHDPVSGEYGNGHRKKDIVFSLSFTPTSEITITPVYYYGDDYFTAPATVTYAQNCAIGTSNSYCGDLDHNKIGPSIATPDGSGATGLKRSVNHFHIDANFAYQWGVVDVLAGVNNIHTVSIDDFDGLENGTTWDLYAPAANNPFAGNPPVGTVLAKNFFGDQAYENDKSVEVRYKTPANEPLRFGVGGYYYDHDSTNNNTFGIDGINIPAGTSLNFIAEPYVSSGGQSLNPLNYAESKARDYSGFISGDWDIVPVLTLSTVVRYTTELQRELIGSKPPITDVEKTFNSVTSNTSLSWKIDDNFRWYVAAANGEKSGGFNGAAKSPLDLAFAPETDVNIETGLRTNFIDNHLQVDATLFHTTVAKLQVLGPPTAAADANQGLIVRNFGDLSTKGFELNARYLLGGLTTSVGFTYTDPRFENGSLDFNDGASCVAVPSCATSKVVTVNGQKALNLSGLIPPFASELAAVGSVQYKQPIGIADWAAFGRVDYRHESRQYTSVTDFAYYGPRNVVNLHFGVENPTWSAVAIILNATNNQTPTGFGFNGTLNGFDPPPVGTFGVDWIPTSILPDPRTYALRVSYHY